MRRLMARTGRGGPSGPGGTAPVVDSGVFPVRPALCARAGLPDDLPAYIRR
ncbi:hypothetical protein ACFY12_28985 [Streptomyces sp. NPDC001339]|uniref:hypothetical protein n=1 Tax=Streptomyces sp. NPDC001339 TaxID=3364563 RepID=UPI003690FD56